MSAMPIYLANQHKAAGNTLLFYALHTDKGFVIIIAVVVVAAAVVALLF